MENHFHRPAQRPFQPPAVSSSICKFNISGACNAAHCRFVHAVRKVSESRVPCCVNELCIVEDSIYAVAGNSMHALRGEALKLEVEVPLPQKACSVEYFPPFLVSGLADGALRIFDKATGACTDISSSSHAPQNCSAEVHALLMHQGVLLAGSWDGHVRLWAAGFNPIGCINSGFGGVKSMRMLGSVLILGCLQGLVFFDSATLQPVAKIPCASPVMGMEIVGAHCVAVTLNGEILVVDGAGSVAYKKSLSEIDGKQHSSALSIAIVDGRGLIIGEKGGSCNILRLPDMTPIGSFSASPADIRCILAAPGIFSTGDGEGRVALWKLGNI